jgi:hypothetical protein
LIHSWEEKERRHGKKMHGKIPGNLHEKRVDKKQSYGWLKFVDIMGYKYENKLKMHYID